MSFYLGSTPQGGLLHVTSNSVGESVMQGPPISTTVFHSSLPYVELIGAYTVPINRDTAYDGYGIRNVGPSRTGLITATIPAALFTYFNNDYMVFVSCSSRNSGNVPVVVQPGAQSIYNPSYYNPDYPRRIISSRTFLPSKDVPTGGGYYGNDYTNPNALRTSPVASSSTPYLLLSFNEAYGGIFSNTFLQTRGTEELIDVPASTGTVYVFNVSKSNLELILSSGMSVSLSASSFIINGNGKTLDFNTYSFISTENSSGGAIKISNANRDSVQYGLNVFNLNKSTATGWEFDFTTNNFYIKKVIGSTKETLISPTTKFLTLKTSFSHAARFSHSDDYPNTVLKSYSSAFKFCIVMISGTVTMNGVDLPLPSHYLLVFSNEPGTKSLASFTASFTNNQGGTTARTGKFSCEITSGRLDIKYESTRSGNVYGINSNVDVTISVLAFD